MVFAQGRLKISGGQMLGMGLMRTPLHKQAVAEGAQQARHEHGRGGANAAAVVVMRNIQPLVEAIFNAAKAGAVQFQPLLGIEFLWGRAGQKRDVFILAALGLAQQAGRLRHQGKANLLR